MFVTFQDIREQEDEIKINDGDFKSTEDQETISKEGFHRHPLRLKEALIERVGVE